MSVAATGRDNVSEVKHASDIVDVVGRYLDLKPAGAGRYKALCPFHREKTPSFHVNRDRQIFHCFGCGKGGDVLTFLQEIDGVTFREALEQLADRAGIKLAAFSGRDARDADERPALFQAMSFATKHYRQQLAASVPAQAYLAQRATPEALIEKFEVGFAPDGWNHLRDAAQRAGMKEPTLDAAGLATRGTRGLYDRFRNRVMFPIRDVSGKVVAFGGRTLGDDPAKYINSPESPIYRKGKVLYGLFEARETIRERGEAVLVEGYFDVLRCFEAGVTNAVAPCGTALTDEQARTIRRYAGSVVVVFDGDERATSLLVAAQGVGAVVGAFTLGWATHRFGLWRVMTGSIAVLAGALVVYGSAPALWVAAIGVAGCGFGYGLSFTTFAGLSQQAASEDMRGRVLAVNTFILGALYPLGALVQGWLADRVGLPWVTAGSGVLLAIGLAWRIVVIGHRRHRRRAGDDPAGPARVIAT